MNQTGLDSSFILSKEGHMRFRPIGAPCEFNPGSHGAMVASEPSWLERLEEYVELFREDFRRRDQIRWAAVYLQGLLLEGQAKTIGAVSRRVALPPDLIVDDVAQALQNFVNQSPWDERKLWRRHRQMFGSLAAEPDGVFVLEDMAFAKQGRHSVGVQRQYSGVLGHKTNCQIAVALYHFSAVGAATGDAGGAWGGVPSPQNPLAAVATTALLPLALRLYLPRSWVQNPARLLAAGVPEEYRGPQTRGSVAVELLDLARSEGFRAHTVVVGSGLGTDLPFREALAERGLHYLIEASPDLVISGDETLWTLTAVDGQTGMSPSSKGRTLLTNVPAENRDAALGQLARCQELLPRTRQILLEELGLDHFEGRSWRGFHHHVCLVALAYSFRALQPPLPRHSPSSML